MTTAQVNTLYGVVAEFSTPEEILHAAKEVRAAGYQEIRAYTPYRLEGLSEILKYKETALPWVVYIGILVGLASGFALQYYTDVINYPLNIGGRPYLSWPAFIMPMYELAILFGALGAFFGMLLRNGLPLPYHPIFNTPDFALGSGNRFYLCIKVTDKRFHLQRTQEFLQSLNPKAVSEVES
jgi:hypothetical protein